MEEDEDPQDWDHTDGGYNYDSEHEEDSCVRQLTSHLSPEQVTAARAGLARVATFHCWEIKIQIPY